MKTIKRGDSGAEVMHLQKALKGRGYSVSADGVFGQQTYEAVCRFQRSSGLAADGIVGPVTWKALLQGSGPDAGALPKPAPEKENDAAIDFEKAARMLNVERAAIRAVHLVESGGRTGFLPDGRPMILFEGHIFWGELKKRGIDPGEHLAENGDILFPKWNSASYKGGAAEHDRLNRACRIDREAALMSASWGMFQIMGFNHKLCGFGTVPEYVAAMHGSPNRQFMAFIDFLKSTRLDVPLRELRWADFAKRYNGPGYKSNRYDEKLRAAYLQYRRSGG